MPKKRTEQIDIGLLGPLTVDKIGAPPVPPFMPPPPDPRLAGLEAQISAMDAPPQPARGVMDRFLVPALRGLSYGSMDPVQARQFENQRIGTEFGQKMTKRKALTDQLSELRQADQQKFQNELAGTNQRRETAAADLEREKFEQESELQDPRLRAAEAQAGIAEVNLRTAQNPPSTTKDYAPGTLVITRDASGKEISREVVPIKPTVDTSVTEAELAVKAAAGDQQAAKALELLRQQQTARQPMPYVIQTPAGPQIVDRTAGTARPITDASGNEIPLMPTSEQRNRGQSMRRIEPILNGISELSEKINTGQGLVAKAQGEAAKLAAKANYDDDVAEYQALISGFTPMVARAVGHVGVLTELDVQSIRVMFPQPGDSKTLRDRKLNRIRTILAAEAEIDLPGGQPSGSGTATPPSENRVIQYDAQGRRVQ